MGNLMLSLLGNLSGKAYNLFLLVIAIGFFGVYVPLNERKKRQGTAQSTQKSPQKEKKEPTPLSRPAALGVLVVCLPLAVVGLTVLIASAVMADPPLIALGAVLSGASLVGLEKAGRDLRAAPRPSKPQSPPRSARPVDRDRLEQLETLRDAGVLTEEEYRERRTELWEEKR